jgi:hypothetical protein
VALNTAVLHVRGSIEPIHNKTFGFAQLIEGLLLSRGVVINKIPNHVGYLTVCDLVPSLDETNGLGMRKVFIL